MTQLSLPRVPQQAYLTGRMVQVARSDGGMLCADECAREIGYRRATPDYRAFLCGWLDMADETQSLGD